MNMTLRSFESKVLYFNGMYKLPIAPIPCFATERKYQIKEQGVDKDLDGYSIIAKRLADFKKILLDEVSEVDEIIQKLADGQPELELLTDLADWLGDIQVYCASEMARYGIPLNETLAIIMASNFSKMGADGKPIIKDGKVQKGPGYWKPEPQIHAMLKVKQDDY